VEGEDVTLLRKADGYHALIRLNLALASAEGEDVDLMVEGLIEFADRTEAYIRRFDTPESARLKCERAIHDFKPPPVAPQREADSDARVPSPGVRVAPSQAWRGA
jgi:hypothetical protein